MTTQTQQSLQKLKDFYPRPDWVRGAIPFDDAKLFIDIIEKHVKGPMIETGVASGWSSAVLLSLFEQNPPCEGVWLHSYDVVDCCYFDLERKVGSVVEEVIPRLKEHWQLHLGGALNAAQDNSQNPVGWAFIDADHRHPYAALDLIALLPALKEDAWVVFHDINLPLVTTVEQNKVYGPKYLFDAWPWEKIATDSAKPNMGAVKLPGDHVKVREFCVGLLDKPWEADVPASLLEKLGLSDFQRKV